MSGLWLLVRKELRELARPQYLIPWLVIPLILVITAQGVGAVGEEAGEQPEIVLVDEDGGEYATVVAETFEASADVTRLDAVPADVGAHLREGDADTLFVIPEGFTERIRGGERGEIAVHTAVSQVSLSNAGIAGRNAGLLEAANTALTATLTGADETALSPTTTDATTYVKGTTVGASLGTVSDALSFVLFMFAFVIVFAVFGAGQLVITGMGSEREDRTLETLLAMPIERRTIVTAKVTASAAVGIGLALLYALAIGFAMPDFGGDVPVPTMGLTEYAILFVSLSLAIVDILALALLVGSFAKDSKAAQTMLMPIGFLTMVPAFVIAYFDLSSFGLPIQAILYAIPSTHPVIAPQELLFGDLTVVLAGMAYMAVLAVVLLYAVVRLFASDRLITRDAGWVGRLFAVFQR